MRDHLWDRLRHRWEDMARSRDGAADSREAPALCRRADVLLRQMLGPRAGFREGQWEAIEAVVVRRERVLVVQRTGWGKSLVYFLTARLLRERGAGPTLLISPLLSLMRNQVIAAERIGVRACTIHGDNRHEWASVEAALERDECDVLLVSPERLRIGPFLSRTLSLLRGKVGMVAVDEAHCISDWGHDFRPDYRRIRYLLGELPAGAAVVATTATANDRVVADISEQLGPGLKVYRGRLARATLSLHVMEPADQPTRLAWLADQLPRLPGSGIIYCLTVADCRRVSDWLLYRGIAAPPYYSALEEHRVERETLLLENRVKALVATVALGMGFDKPDLGFVIHYQRPGSVVAYYQQVGRAGRAIDTATVALLHGAEDEEVHEHFLRSAFPEPGDMLDVLAALQDAGRTHRGGLTEYELLGRVNVAPARLEQMLKLLEIDGAVRWQRGRYRRTERDWAPDEERWRRVLERRRRELAMMRAYAEQDGCRMRFLTRELDDPDGSACGRCDRCTGRPLPASPPEVLVQEAFAFLRSDLRVIEPRRRWPDGGLDGIEGPLRFPNQPGRALCLYGDGGWGQAVPEGKYRDGRFSDGLVEACAELVRGRWQPDPPPQWVTAVPSLRRPDLVPEFAARLAGSLGLPFHPVLQQVRSTAEQKEMKNSTQQARNIFDAFQVVTSCPPGPVLLVDDVVDSRWTFTVAGHRIRQAGGGPVYPLALAEAAGRSGPS
jgi:ATP-dependent DNA helicase RecQ